MPDQTKFVDENGVERPTSAPQTDAERNAAAGVAVNADAAARAEAARRGQPTADLRVTANEDRAKADAEDAAAKAAEVDRRTARGQPTDIKNIDETAAGQNPEAARQAVASQVAVDSAFGVTDAERRAAAIGEVVGSSPDAQRRAAAVAARAEPATTRAEGQVVPRAGEQDDAAEAERRRTGQFGTPDEIAARARLGRSAFTPDERVRSGQPGQFVSDAVTAETERRRTDGGRDAETARRLGLSRHAAGIDDPDRRPVDAKEQARIDARKAEPTIEEIEFVARAMDYDSSLDWENRPERCDNARVAAKMAILGYRACLRLEAKAEPDKELAR